MMMIAAITSTTMAMEMPKLTDALLVVALDTEPVP